MVLGDQARKWWNNGTSVTAQLSDPYRVRHGDAPRWPPARWEVLARERALALAMTKLGVRLATDVQSWEFVIEGRYFSCTYVPSWVYLPPDLIRPRTVPAIRALVCAVFDHDVDAARATVARLAASPAAARSFYADADAAWERKFRERALYIIRRGYDDERPAFQEHEDRFFAAYPNGLAIVAALKAMRSEVKRQFDALEDKGTTPEQRNAQEKTLWERYPEGSAICQAYNAMADAFETEACRIADAAWHDVWTVDALVSEGNDEPEEFSGVMDDLRWNNDRPAPFRCGTSERIELSDPSGWSTWQWHARTAVAALRRCLLKGWRDKVIDHFDEGPWVLPTPIPGNAAGCSDADLLAVGDRAVATVDAVKASFAACCTLPVVVQVGDTDAYWVGGLSPAGHLVGTMTTGFSK